MARKKGSKVPAKSTKLIRREADYIRSALRLGKVKINMISLMEFILPRLLPSFHYDVIGKDLMGNDEALTYPDKSLICIREDVYYALTSGDRRAQFTLAHEVGHLVMHVGLSESVSYARNSLEHEGYEDSEWQADTFAAEFLMPYEIAIRCKSADEIYDKFGVSRAASRIRYKKIH